MVQVFDPYFLAMSAIISFGIQLVFFVVAAGLKFDKVTDFAYGLGFLVLAVILLILNETYFTRQIIVCVEICLWGIRLAGFLLARIINMGSDKRFDGIRESIPKFAVFWLIQFFTVFVVSLPSIFLFAFDKDPSLGARDVVGIVMFVIGLVIEAVADQQKFNYKNSEKKENWADTGLWRISRHPNYFGELLCWWGVFTTCASVFDEHPWKYFSVIGPLFLTFTLLFFSGIPRIENSHDKKYGDKPEYHQYLKQTSPLIPLPPGVYSKLPMLVKRIFFFEYPLYRASPSDDDDNDKTEKGENDNNNDKKSVESDSGNADSKNNNNSQNEKSTRHKKKKSRSHATTASTTDDTPKKPKSDERTQLVEKDNKRRKKKRSNATTK